MTTRSTSCVARGLRIQPAIPWAPTRTNFTPSALSALMMSRGGITFFTCDSDGATEVRKERAWTSSTCTSHSVRAARQVVPRDASSLQSLQCVIVQQAVRAQQSLTLYRSGQSVAQLLAGQPRHPAAGLLDEDVPRADVPV